MQFGGGSGCGLSGGGGVVWAGEGVVIALLSGGVPMSWVLCTYIVAL